MNKNKLDPAAKSEECLICGEGKLTHLIDYNQVEYKGSTGFVALHYSTCDVCGSEQADAEDTRINKRAMQEFKKGGVWYMNKPKHITLKVLDMFYFLDYLARLEAIEQKMEYVHKCHLSEYGEKYSRTFIKTFDQS